MPDKSWNIFGARRYYTALFIPASRDSRNVPDKPLYQLLELQPGQRRRNRAISGQLRSISELGQRGLITAL